MEQFLIPVKLQISQWAMEVGLYGCPHFVIEEFLSELAAAMDFNTRFSEFDRGVMLLDNCVELAQWWHGNPVLPEQREKELIRANYELCQSALRALHTVGLIDHYPRSFEFRSIAGQAIAVKVSDLTDYHLGVLRP